LQTFGVLQRILLKEPSGFSGLKNPEEHLMVAMCPLKNQVFEKLDKSFFLRRS
jgi:hypothetical protein